MRYKHMILGALILGFAISAGAPVAAQTSKLYDRIGMLDALNPEQGRVVIFDVLYTLHKSVKVYRFNPDVDNRKPKNREEVSLKMLTPGMTLGYMATYNGNTQPGNIKEIWILPSDNIAAMHSETDETDR